MRKVRLLLLAAALTLAGNAIYAATTQAEEELSCGGSCRSTSECLERAECCCACFPNPFGPHCVTTD